MPHKLYVYLSGGRGDAYVTDQWDGAPPDEEGMVDEEGVVVGGANAPGKQVGRPYRDIFSATLEFNTPPIDVGAGDDYKPVSGRHTAHGSYHIDAPTPAAWATGTSYVIAASGLVADDVHVSHSDEMVHRPPRQHYEVHTWLIFKETGETGATFKFRKDLVIGWGKHARAE